MDRHEALELISEAYKPMHGPDTLYDYILLEVNSAFADKHDHHNASCPKETLTGMLEQAQGDLERLTYALRDTPCEDDGLECDESTLVGS